MKPKKPPQKRHYKPRVKKAVAPVATNPVVEELLVEQKPLRTPSKPLSMDIVVPKKKTITHEVVIEPVKKPTWRERLQVHKPRISNLSAVLILVLSVLVWGSLGIHLHQHNADHIVDSYLFESQRTFRGAAFPGSHTQLLKWPLFWLVGHWGVTYYHLEVVSLGVLLVTVLGFAWLLYKINHHSYVFAILCLALASMLLFVPTLPYPGALLPLNMAMFTTRNIEYVIYLAALVLLIRARKGLKSPSYWLGVVCLTLLVVSDRLFLTLGLGGSGLALMFYLLTRRKLRIEQTVRLLIASGLAAAISSGLLWLLNHSHATHIVANNAAGPYGLVRNLHDVLLASMYGVLAIFTNFGSNPAYDTTVFRQIPHVASERLLGWTGFSFLTNGLVLLAGLLTVPLLFFREYLKKISPAPLSTGEDDTPQLLSVVLVWSSVAAFLAYVLTKHYYAVDGRYLGLLPFALFVVMATMTRRTPPFTYRKTIVICGLLFVSVCLGIFFQKQTYATSEAASSEIRLRDKSIARLLDQHPVNVLVGDYWRVLPIRLDSHGRQEVLPLESCTTPRQTLSSSAWQPALNKTSFAYLLTIEGSQTDFPNCQLDPIIQAYGRPNASVLVTGTPDHPKEILLFYDRGAHQSAPKQLLSRPSTILPIGLDQLPNTNCSASTNIMTIVAHEDDDLLFINPDTSRSISNKQCVRTVFVTAGDAGAGLGYWLGREQGAEAAYGKMLGTNDIWIERIIKLREHAYIKIANPRGNASISLIFMHLPDGNLQGQGFHANSFQSLSSLEAGNIATIRAIDDQSLYTYQELMQAVEQLINVYKPAEIRTQSSFKGGAYPDHSDHRAVGRLVQKVQQDLASNDQDTLSSIPITYYIGYPIHQLPQNIFGDQLHSKKSYFDSYDAFDRAVCADSGVQCEPAEVFKLYLERQYTYPY